MGCFSWPRYILEQQYSLTSNSKWLQRLLALLQNSHLVRLFGDFFARTKKESTICQDELFVLLQLDKRNIFL